MKRIWSVEHSSGQAAEILGDALGISPIVSQILVQRGYCRPEEAIEFLRPSLLNLNSPFSFREMPLAVERLSAALQRKEKVLVYGDYDVDGVTSTTLLYKVLIDLGFKAVAYIPHRQDEGYGLHSEVLERAAKAGVGVVITVDCGITAVSEVELARALQIDVIITDHHEPQDVLPKAQAIINPKLENSGYPFRDLAGVGVAFKLAQALLERIGKKETGSPTEIELMDLVALGTIADLVPLSGENRILVHYGLLQMEATNHPGLSALLKECGLKDKPLKAGQIGFMVAPRINAAGRMDSARTGLELLLSEDPERAAELAGQLTRENQSRQETEKEILAEAIAMLEGELLPRVIVLSSDHWHHGVIGIVASRLVERYYRPVFLIAEEGEEAKGSARGIPGYPVLEQLSTQARLLTKYGGHKQAAGFALPTKDIDQLRKGLNEQALLFPEALFQEVLRIDCQVSLDKISGALLNQLEKMAPFGFGNPGPMLGCQRLPVHSVTAVGKDQAHLKFRFGRQGEEEGIAFRLGERLEELKDQPELDAAFSLDWNSYRGEEAVQLIIKDIQRKADWRNSSDESDSVRVYQEIAVASEEPGVRWLDWRGLSPADWPLPSDEPIWVWDNTVNRPSLRLEKTIAGKDETIKPSLGVILGLPLTEEDFNEGVQKLQELGVGRIALADFHSPPEEKVHHRCGYISREELIGYYRELQAKSKQGNPFYWELRKETPDRAKTGLKIFEELGLIRCLGGSDAMLLEWIPVKNKLDLDSSLRYRYAKRCLEKALKFRAGLLGAALG